MVDSNLTLSTLVSSIASLSGINYAYTYINPINLADGGEPGGNIRNAYLYKPSLLRLSPGAPIGKFSPCLLIYQRKHTNPKTGSSLNATAVLPGPALSLNPGRIDPTNEAWTASRKPLAAQWETLDGKNKFFTINVHFGSKGGSSGIEGDYRPPVNGGVGDREAQMTITAVCLLHPFLLSTLDPTK